jgi:hypothetical protein
MIGTEHVRRFYFASPISLSELALQLTTRTKLPEPNLDAENESEWREFQLADVTLGVARSYEEDAFHFDCSVVPVGANYVVTLYILEGESQHRSSLDVFNAVVSDVISTLSAISGCEITEYDHSDC